MDNELYKYKVELSRAGREIPYFDVDRGWHELKTLCEARHNPDPVSEKRTPMTPHQYNIFWRRVAAVVAVLACVSAIAMVGIFTIGTPSSTHKGQPVQNAPSAQPKVIEIEREQAISSPTDLQPLTFNAATLDEILKEIADRYEIILTSEEPIDTMRRYHLTIPAEVSVEQAIATLNQFDDISIAIENNTIIVR